MSEDTIQKNESVPSTTSIRPPVKEMGQPRIVSSGNFIQSNRDANLAMPRMLTTIDEMYDNDDAVYTSHDHIVMQAVKGLVEGKVRSTGTRKSDVATQFVEYLLHNHTYGTWLEYCYNALTSGKYGFSFQNIVLEKRTYGPYKGKYCIKSLAPRDQKSLQGWVWDKDKRYLEGILQKPMLKSRRSNNKAFEHVITNTSSYSSADYTYIPIEHLTHFRHNPTNNNPQGDTPFIHCYNAYMEKRLIENLEIVGMQKDLSGTLILRIPADHIEEANDPENTTGAREEYISIQTDAANMLNGQKGMMVLSSETKDNQYVYDMQLKGIEGSAKQYITSEVIKDKRTSIYNSFGTAHMLLGQGGSGGSNKLSSNQMTTTDYQVEQRLLWASDAINNQLIRRLLEHNKIFLSPKDMPVFQFSDPSVPDIEALSKAFQRLKTSDGLTPRGAEWMYDKMGMPTEGVSDLDYESKGTSRAGEGQGTSGNGNDQQSADDNLENKSLDVIDVINDNGTLINEETGKPLSQ